jgi:hypothetical protein
MDEGNSWTVYRTRFLVRARQLTEPLVFTDSLGREQSGEPGDYLVESSEGVKRITARILFEDIYVPLATPLPARDEHSGRCRPGGTPNSRSSADFFAETAMGMGRRIG